MSGYSHKCLRKLESTFRVETSNKWALCYTKSLTLDDVEVKNKVVLVRVGFNSPIDPETKKIIDDSRIRAHGESTIKELSEKGARLSFWRIKDARVIQILYP